MLKNLLLLTGFSTFAVIIIVGFNIYHNLTISSLPDTTQIRIIPIKPTFDKETITKLRDRVPLSVSLIGKSEVVSEDSKEVDTSANGIKNASSSGSIPRL